MPHLTDLDILWATEEPAVASTVWHSVAQYLPQLIRLALLHIDDKLYRASWDDQFSPTLPPALSLTHFETSQALGDGLLGFLLSHVPNLAYLRAGSVCARKAVHSGKQWGLREFHSDDLRGYDMSKLPRPKNGPVRVSNFWLDLSLDVGVEGLPARDVWALSDCVLVPHPSNPSRHPRILLNPSSTLEDSIEAQPQALATAIRQLACMQQQPNVVCYISDWEWSAELCAAVGEAMADVPQLQLGFRSSNHVTDEEWAYIMALGPKLRHVWAWERLYLESSAHTLAPWPWDSISAPTFNSRTLMRFPIPVPLGKQRLMRGTIALNLTYDQVVSGAAALLADKLWGVHLTEPLELQCSSGIVLQCPQGLPPELQPAVLRAEISVLQGITVHALGGVTMGGYTLTRALVAELANLPEWEARLALFDCELGPDGLHAFTSLAAHVPTSYPRWAVGRGDVPTEHITAVCMGVMKHRAAGLPPLSLHCMPEGAEEQHLCEQITLKPWSCQDEM